MGDQYFTNLANNLTAVINVEKFKASDNRRRKLEENAEKLQEETASKVRKLKHEASLETVKITSGGWPEKSPYDLAENKVDQKALNKDKQAFIDLMNERLNEALTKLSAGDYIWLGIDVENAVTDVFKKFRIASVDRRPDPNHGSLIFFDEKGEPEFKAFGLFAQESEETIGFFPQCIEGFDKDTVLPIYQCFNFHVSGKAATFISE